MKLEKLLNVWVLIAINIGIIIAAELSGSFFLESGLIHIIALGFLLLGLSRIFVHYNVFDRYLQPLTLGTVAALVLFSVSHLFEYYSFSTGGEFYSDALYVHVTNMYLTAMLLVSLGAQYFLSVKDNTWTQFYTVAGVFCVSALVTVASFIWGVFISIEPDESDVYLYAIVAVAITVYSVYKMLQIGRTVSIMKHFTAYVAVAFVLVIAAGLHYLLYEILEHAGIPELQIIYVSHFLFYAALSLLFLAFPRLAKLGGIYESVK